MEQLLRQHLELERLPGFPDLPSKPKLLVGATDVLKGEGGPLPGKSLTYKDGIASAAIPPIFRAIRTRESAYWDGLFNREIRRSGSSPTFRRRTGQRKSGSFVSILKNARTSRSA